jgi:hypothetical protein
VAYAASFILGTQERRFFAFLFEVARIVVQVPNEGQTPAFQITDIQPRQGTANDLLVLRGSGFAPNLVVTIGGNPIEHVAVSADGMAAAGLLPAHAPGPPVEVTIRIPNGESATLPAAFTYVAVS